LREPPCSRNAAPIAVGARRGVYWPTERNLKLNFIVTRLWQRHSVEVRVFPSDGL